MLDGGMWPTSYLGSVRHRDFPGGLTSDVFLGRSEYGQPPGSVSFDQRLDRRPIEWGDFCMLSGRGCIMKVSLPLEIPRLPCCGGSPFCVREL